MQNDNIYGFSDHIPWVGFRKCRFKKIPDEYEQNFNDHSHNLNVDQKQNTNWIYLPKQWNISGKFFLVYAQNAEYIAVWPYDIHGMRVAQIYNLDASDLDKYDEKTRNQLLAELNCDCASIVENGWLEIPSTLLENIGLDINDSSVVGILGMQDHFEIWEPNLFENTALKIDLSYMFEK